MALNKQVSPVIRISQGERDASARATHLEAATRKFLVTTNERKKMSTKTNFKRIALVAVAALGLGVLSSVPSQAEVVGTVSITTTNGTALVSALAGSADSTTAGSVKVSWIAGVSTDSVVISSYLTAKPSASTGSPKLVLMPKDTLTSVTAATLTGGGYAPVTAGTGVDTGVIASVAAGYASGTFYAQIDSITGGRAAGTYTWTVVATPWHGISSTGAPVTSADTGKAVQTTISIVIAALASESKVANAGFSSAIISDDGAGSTDEDVSALATASGSPVASITVKLRNTAGVTLGTAARESVTVTTDIGTVGVAGGTFGRSVVLQYNSDDSLTVQVRPDGTAGQATITVTTPSVTFTPKKLTFYATTISTIVATKLNGVIGAGSTSNVILSTAKDAKSNLNAALDMVYAYSSDTSIVSNYGTACATFSASSGGQLCALTGVASGTAKITLRDAATVAASTVASNVIEVVVNTSPAVSVKLSLNKASYAPGEKAFVLLTAYDAAGKVVPAISSGALLSSAGVYTSAALGTGSADLVSGYATLATATSTGSGGVFATTDPVKQWTVYMPVTGGPVTFTAKGGTYLPTAGQVTLTASATVTDNAAAALAAVTALATTVASLKTLITTLTNLVLKIQKKVKA